MKRLPIFCSFIFSSLYFGSQTMPAAIRTANQKTSPDDCNVVGKILTNRESDFKNNYTEPTTDFCKKLSEIMTHARTNFEKIKTEENQDPEEPPLEGEVFLVNSLIHKASLKFPGAKLSSILEGMRGPDKYDAYFGYSETETLATKKIDSIKMQLASCLKGYNVQKESRSDYSGEYPVIYVFDEKRTDKMPGQHLKLLIAKKEIYLDHDNIDVFKIYLYINGLRPL